MKDYFLTRMNRQTILRWILKRSIQTLGIFAFLMVGPQFLMAITGDVFADPAETEHAKQASKQAEEAQKEKEKKEKEEKKKEQEKKESEKIKEGGVLKCKFDVGCYFNHYLYKNQQWIIKNFASLLKLFAFEPNAIFENKTFNSYYENLKSLSWTIMGFFLLFQTVKIASRFAVNYDPVETKSLIQRTAVAAALLGGLTPGFKLLLTLNNKIVEGFTGSFKLEKFQSMLDLPLYSQGVVWLLIIMAVLLVVLCFQFAIRYAELGFLLLIGNITIITHVNEEFNLFPVWYRHLIATIFTQAVQVALIVMMISGFVNIRIGSNPFYTYVGAIGTMILIIKVPNLLKEWAYSTGVGRTLGGSVAGVGTTVVKSLIRKKVGG